jgi:threonylcarbamoyladenosine tRNA methylthiotransferase MtaB
MEAIDSKKFRCYYIDRQVEVLIEEIKEIQGSKYYIGHTKEYVKVAVEITPDIKENTLVTGVIVGFLTDEILIMH